MGQGWLTVGLSVVWPPQEDANAPKSKTTPLPKYTPLRGRASEAPSPGRMYPGKEQSGRGLWVLRPGFQETHVLERDFSYAFLLVLLQGQTE